MAWTLPDRLAPLANRIPPTIKAELTDAELLARCERADELTTSGFAVNDRTTMYGYLQRADQVLKAMTPRQLAADVGVLAKGLSAAPHGLAGSYASASAQLQADHPQPSAEQLAKAAAVVAAANGWTRTPSTPAAAPTITRALSSNDTILYK